MPLSHLLLCLSIAATLLPVRAPWPWLSLLIMAVTAGLVHGQLTIVAMVPVAALAALAWMAIEARHRPRREAVLMLLMLVIGFALALHLLPGFLNPTYLATTSDARPPTLKYLNFDKGVAGMLMLAVLASQQRRRSEGRSEGRSVGMLPKPAPGAAGLPCCSAWPTRPAGPPTTRWRCWPDSATVWLTRCPVASRWPSCCTSRSTRWSS